MTAHAQFRGSIHDARNDCAHLVEGDCAFATEGDGCHLLQDLSRMAFSSGLLASMEPLP